MNKKGIANVLIGLTVFVVIAVVIAGVIWTQLTDQTTQTAVVDDQFTSSNETCVDITDSCFIGGSASAEPAANTSALYVTDCVVSDGNGVTTFDGVIIGNDSYTGQTTNATYTGVECNYISSGMSRTIVLFLPILVAVAIFVAVAAFVK